MPRVKGGPRGHRKHIKIIALAKGYRGTRSKHFKRANEAVVRAGEHAFAGRRLRRRDIRRLWITRINGALTSHNIKYSRFIAGLKKAHIELDRKSLAEMAVNDVKGFDKVVAMSREYLSV
jgi:large subunit ribosomal protein L20